ncbi:hypothetical protein [Chryseobacterium sp. WLY505]|uniref:hypothetical protein n=1 Tax=Chryseobacterium sp. WLY505 TaxID=3068892 RepID=UPI0027967026|nr:hypothetical protein [Chryseobacterium sp. WLY505]MDQ1859002.1 hypothetical protein [Chryseobacterium sp. WLY505]
MKTHTTTQILDYTNARLKDWYNEVKDYGVNGGAVAFLYKGKIVIDYSENGVNGRFHLNHYEGEAIDYVFNVWSEDANLENDKVA